MSGAMSDNMSSGYTTNYGSSGYNDPRYDYTLSTYKPGSAFEHVRQQQQQRQLQTQQGSGSYSQGTTGISPRHSLQPGFTPQLVIPQIGGAPRNRSAPATPSGGVTPDNSHNVSNVSLNTPRPVESGDNSFNNPIVSPTMSENIALLAHNNPDTLS